MTQTPLPRLVPRLPIVIGLVIAACTLVESALILGDFGMLGLPRLRQTAYEYAGFWPGLLGGWTPNYGTQPYAMFLSYAFLHTDIKHFVFNMITLYSLGGAVWDRVGTRGFLILYVAAILGGGLGFGLLADTLRPMVGASGGLFGLAGGILAWNYVDRFTESRQLWPIVWIILGLLFLNLALWWLMDGLLAWETHLGGFVFGWIAALLIDPRSQSNG
ncbi:MAG: rhomboid family intramembrane serine protease [Paracoccaceae bacterium]